MCPSDSLCITFLLCLDGMMPTGPLTGLVGGFNEIINAKTEPRTWDLGSTPKVSYFYLTHCARFIEK